MVFAVRQAAQSTMRVHAAVAAPRNAIPLTTLAPLGFVHGSQQTSDNISLHDALAGMYRFGASPAQCVPGWATAIHYKALGIETKLEMLSTAAANSGDVEEARSIDSFVVSLRSDIAPLLDWYVTRYEVLRRNPEAPQEDRQHLAAVRHHLRRMVEGLEGFTPLTPDEQWFLLHARELPEYERLLRQAAIGRSSVDDSERLQALRGLVRRYLVETAEREQKTADSGQERTTQSLLPEEALLLTGISMEQDTPETHPVPFDVVASAPDVVELYGRMCGKGMKQTHAMREYLLRQILRPYADIVRIHALCERYNTQKTALERGNPPHSMRLKQSDADPTHQEVMAWVNARHDPKREGIPQGTEYVAYVQAHDIEIPTSAERGILQNLLQDKKKGGWLAAARAAVFKELSPEEHPLIVGFVGDAAGLEGIHLAPASEAIGVGSSSHGEAVFARLARESEAAREGGTAVVANGVSALEYIGVDRGFLRYIDRRFDTAIRVSLDAFALDGTLRPEVVLGAIYASGAGCVHSNSAGLIPWMQGDTRIVDETGMARKVVTEGKTPVAMRVLRFAFEHPGQGDELGRGGDPAGYRDLHGAYSPHIRRLIAHYGAWLVPGLPMVYAGRSLGAQWGIEAAVLRLLTGEASVFPVHGVYGMGAWDSGHSEAHALGYIEEQFAAVEQEGDTRSATRKGFAPNWPVMDLLSRWGGIAERELPGEMTAEGLSRLLGVAASDVGAATQAERTQWTFQRTVGKRLVQLRELAAEKPFVDPETGEEVSFDDLLAQEWLPFMMQATRDQFLRRYIGRLARVGNIVLGHGDLQDAARLHQGALQATIDAERTKVAQGDERGMSEPEFRDPWTGRFLSLEEALALWEGDVSAVLRQWEARRAYFRGLHETAGYAELNFPVVSFSGMQDLEYQWHRLDRKSVYPWQPQGREILLQESLYFWQGVMAATGITPFFNPWAGHDHRARERVAGFDLPTARERAALESEDPCRGPQVPTLEGVESVNQNLALAAHVTHISGGVIAQLFSQVVDQNRDMINLALGAHGMAIVD